MSKRDLGWIDEAECGECGCQKGKKANPKAQLFYIKYVGTYKIKVFKEFSFLPLGKWR